MPTTFTLPQNSLVTSDVGHLSDHDDVATDLSYALGLLPSGDTTGATDKANLQALINLTGKFKVSWGQFYVNGPLLIQVDGVTMEGWQGSTQSGNAASADLGTIIRPVAAFSTTPLSGGPANNAVIMVLDSTPGTGGTTTNIRFRDFWVDCTASPANVDGISGFGPCQSIGFESIGVYNTQGTGRGFAAYSDTFGGANFTDGWSFRNCLAQNCGGDGFHGLFVDTTFINCHAQSCGGDGFYNNGGNNRYICCRSDLNANGFTFDDPSTISSSSFSDPQATLVGCGTQGNNKNGLNVINSSGTGGSTRSPVMLSACTFDGDGQNSGSGGGGYAGIAVAGRNIVMMTNCAVWVATEWVAAGSPAYGLATATAGSGPTGPDIIQMEGGFLGGVTAMVNDAGGTARLAIGRSVLGYAGSGPEYASNASTPATHPGGPAAPFGSTPTAPAGTASTAALVMMGLGTNATGTPWAYTPASSGVCLVSVTGFANTTTGLTFYGVGCRFGTGTAPVNGATLTGTRFGSAGDPNVESGAVSEQAAFSFTALLSLTKGTAYWFDLALKTGNASDTATLADVSITIVETS